MAPHRFELVGGDPALDFLNTVHDWTREPRVDYLTALGDAVRWGEAAGVLTRAEARRLASHDDRAELARLVALRDVLQRVASGLIAGGTPLGADLDALAAESAEAASATRLEGSGGGLRRAIRWEDAGTALLRLRIADAALALLTTESVRRVKSCPACGWFFVDATRNRSRRWCSMSTCGASAKSRRYYQRTRARRSRKR